MPGSVHGWLYLKDQAGGVDELINQARTASYLAHPDLAVDGIDICDILDFGGCENYAWLPACHTDEGGWVDLPGVAGNNMTVPDAAALDIIGDCCIIFGGAADDWTPGANVACVAKYTGTGNQRSWALMISTTGQIMWIWTTLGTGASQLLSATVPTLASLAPGAHKYIAITFDVDNGAAGRTTRYWTSSDRLNWSLFDTDIDAGTTSIFSSTSVVEIGSVDSLSNWAGTVDYVSIRSGFGPGGTVGGTEVFGFSRDSLEGVSFNASSVTADTGQTVTVNHSGATPTFITPFVAAYESWEEQTFDTPATDDAPWWNSNYAESSDALGFYIDEWTGLDDGHVKRQMIRTGRDRGGASPGVISNQERIMKLNIILFARSEEAMMYLFRWLAATLESVCSSCASNTILVRDYCGDTDEPVRGVVEMRDVALVEGLTWEAPLGNRGSCFVRRASFALSAGDPCMYLPDTEPTVVTSSAALGTCLLAADYSLTRRPCRPSCSELDGNCRSVWSWDATEAMGALAPVITFQNDNSEHAFPFRAILYHNPDDSVSGIGTNPCGLMRLGEVYVRPMPPYSFMRWDVAGREIEYRDATTGDWVSGWPFVDANDPPLQRYFTLPCGGRHHLVLEPATLCVERIGVVGNVFEWNGITFTNPHYPSVSISTQERVSCS